MRTAVAKALGKFGPQANQVVPALIGLLEARGPTSTQEAALLSLGGLGTKASLAIPSIEAIRDGSPDIQPDYVKKGAAALEKIKSHSCRDRPRPSSRLVHPGPFGV